MKEKCDYERSIDQCVTSQILIPLSDRFLDAVFTKIVNKLLLQR